MNIKANEGPCLQCSDREVGCHAKCGKYREFRERLDARNEETRSGIDKACALYDYERKRYTRNTGKRRGER